VLRQVAEGVLIHQSEFCQSNAAVADDPRIGPSATFDWMPGVHERQLQQLARRREH